MSSEHATLREAIAEAQLTDARVAMAEVSRSAYDEPDGASLDTAIRGLADALGWSAASGPLDGIIERGARVLIKPNWVLHENQGPWGFEPLVTHGAMVRALTRAALGANAGEVRIGDAPVQSCDFPRLLAASNIDAWAAGLQQEEPRFAGVADFRRTISSVAGDVREAMEGVRSLDQYVLFDLGAESYLEPVTTGEGDFRVTMYPPHLMKRTHTTGRHQYLVAREIVDANVIINAPKLKTHRKAGVTCALKNLVGINGNKEYLPHHRIGGPGEGGDCYPEESVVKRSLERVLDMRNSTNAALSQRALGFVARGLQSIAHRQGDETGVEGAWSGNDTVWRMCLDLNRIVLYGRADGTIAPTPQRTVLSFVDAITAGQGDGPLAPVPLTMNRMLAGRSSAAIDVVGSRLLGYDERLIPIAAHAFDTTAWPLATFSPSEIRVLYGNASHGLDALPLDAVSAAVEHPPGWRSAARPTHP